MLNHQDMDFLFREVLKEVIYKIIKHKHSTYSSELNFAGNRLFGKKFRGTFCSDEFPKLTDKTPYCILNVDSSDLPGSHWLGVCKYTGKEKYLIFDSFGRDSKILISNVCKYLGKNEVVDTRHDKEQLVREHDCGQRSLSFLVLCDLFGTIYSQKL